MVAQLDTPLSDPVASIGGGPVQQLAFSIKGGVAFSGLPESTLRRAIRNGRLKARRSGRRLVILATDFQDFLSALPTHDPRHEH